MFDLGEHDFKRDPDTNDLEPAGRRTRRPADEHRQNQHSLGGKGPKIEIGRNKTGGGLDRHGRKHAMMNGACH